MRAALTVAGLVVMVGRLLAQTPPIVIEVRVTNGGGPFSVNLDRSFGLSPITCPHPSGQDPATIADVLGQSVRTLTVRAYDTSRFQTEDQVRDYIGAMLVARPEGGRMGGGLWSEVTVLQVSIVIEWVDGRFGRFDLGSSGTSQYAHLEDQRGCERWGRFLAP